MSMYSKEYTFPILFNYIGYTASNAKMVTNWEDVKQSNCSLFLVPSQHFPGGTDRDSRTAPGRKSNPIPPKYESETGVPTTNLDVWCQIIPHKATIKIHNISRNMFIIQTTLQRCTLWSTLSFQRCPSHYTTGDDVSRATKGITNATMISKATMVSEVIAGSHGCNVIRGQCYNNVIRCHCFNNVIQQ
jgi:hypothetical protein